MESRVSEEQRAISEARRAGRRLAATIDRAGRKRPSVGLQVPMVTADPPAESPTNLWMMTDGRLRWRTPDGTLYQVAGVTAGTTTSAVALPSDPDVGRTVKVYPALWVETLCPLHGIEAAGDYGTDPRGFHGNRQIMAGFDFDAIRADLTGRQLRQVQMQLTNTATATGGPVELHFGLHNATGRTALFAGVFADVWTGVWPASGSAGTDGWLDAEPYLVQAIADGTATGLTIDQPVGAAYAGTISPASWSLAITYT
jgi:hypothetical protein